MTFQIVGDDVFYNGECILRFVDTPLLVTRDEVYQLLVEWDEPDIETIEGQETDDEVRDELREQLDAMERQRDEAIKQRNNARALADTYAVMLQVPHSKEQWDE